MLFDTGQRIPSTESRSVCPFGKTVKKCGHYLKICLLSNLPDRRPTLRLSIVYEWGGPGGVKLGIGKEDGQPRQRRGSIWEGGITE